MLRIRSALESREISGINLFCKIIWKNRKDLVCGSFAEQRDTGLFKGLFNGLHAPDAFLSQFYVKIVLKQFFKLYAHHPAFCQYGAPLFHVKAEMIFEVFPYQYQCFSEHSPGFCPAYIKSIAELGEIRKGKMRNLFCRQSGCKPGTVYIEIKVMALTESIEIFQFFFCI